MTQRADGAARRDELLQCRSADSRRVNRLAARLLAIGFCVVALPGVASPAHALDPARAVSQYGHNAWRVRDGALPGPAYPIAQTADGYLWIGTQAGVVRFDGVRFVPLRARDGTTLPDSFITSLRAARDGSLWIGTRRSLARWNDGELTLHPGITLGAQSLLEDRDGAIWFATVRGATKQPVCRLRAGELVCFGEEAGLKMPAGGCCIGTLIGDADGGFLISTDLAVLRWKPGQASVTLPVDAKAKAGIPGVIILAGAPQTWVGVDARGSGLGLLRVDGDAIAPFTTLQLDGGTIAVQALFVDRAGSLWIGTLDDGIYRLRGDRVDHYRAADGLSADAVYWFFEDREGNLWVSTAEGVDRFRDLPVTTISKREGLSAYEVDSVLAASDGTIWAGTTESLDAIRDGVVRSIRAGEGLPGHQVTSLLEDHAGRLWVGIDQGLWIYADGTFRPVPGFDGEPLGFVASLAEDAAHTVWARTRKGLVRIDGQTAHEPMTMPPVVLAADPQSGLWLGRADGDLARLRDGRLEVIPGGINKGRLLQLLVTAEGWVLGAGEAGLLGYRDGRQALLTARDGLPCDSLYALVFDDDGALWISSQCGIIAIDAAQLRAWWERPGTRVHPRLFDALDGARPGRAPFIAAARARDGTIWFANAVALESVDPAVARRSPPPPAVRIEEIIADRRAHAPRDGLAIAANPRDVEIDYTALALAVPQRTNFRHRLDGRDEDWQEAGTRRQAFYSDLPPGDYRFRVAARSGDGAWSEDGAAVRFTVAAAWYQTFAFRAAVAVAALLAAAAMYRLRVRRIAAQMRRRFDERLEERTRLARELHDTLLQTIQGSKMVADDALDTATDLAGLRGKMERLSEWLAQAVHEGRAALAALRVTTTQSSDLAERLARAAEECAPPHGLDVALSVHGDARELHPIVRDEVCRIGFEAIRNACAHSSGARLQVALSYARDLTLEVRDDGRGFDPAAIEDLAGHYGVRGMRERAQRIGGTLAITSAPGTGTEVALAVPGKAAYRDAAAPRSVLAGFRRRSGRDDGIDRA
ncbi:sensor histidine kinase [Tahibacter caeni]|uniref:sensor histidine kinase n=1 Tax=Tahibacter caeni TaxID=1453545 RepID=UPI0021471E67|nr:sensor histidine kinase [Tahibacter caeni]